MHSLQWVAQDHSILKSSLIERSKFLIWACKYKIPILSPGVWNYSKISLDIHGLKPKPNSLSKIFVRGEGSMMYLLHITYFWSIQEKKNNLSFQMRYVLLHYISLCTVSPSRCRQSWLSTICCISPINQSIRIAKDLPYILTFSKWSNHKSNTYIYENLK